MRRIVVTVAVIALVVLAIAGAQAFLGSPLPGGGGPQPIGSLTPET